MRIFCFLWLLIYGLIELEWKDVVNFWYIDKIKETSESMSFLKRKIKDSSPQLPVRKVKFGLSE